MMANKVHFASISSADSIRLNSICFDLVLHCCIFAEKQQEFYQNARKVASFERMMKHEAKAGNIQQGVNLDEVR
jgi:hypothetical protein